MGDELRGRNGDGSSDPLVVGSWDPWEEGMGTMASVHDVGMDGGGFLGDRY